MSTPDLQVFSKGLNPAAFTFAPQDLLNTGETISTAVFSDVSPATTNPVSVSNLVVASDGLSFSFTATGGDSGITYGAKFVLTTSLTRTLTVTAAVYVAQDLTTSFTQKSPYAFQALIGTIQAGDAAIGKAFFVLPPGTSGQGGYVTWELIDNNGAVYASGNAFDYYVTAETFYTSIEANAVVSVPSSIPPSAQDQTYQVRWYLNDVPAAGNQQVVSEAVTVSSEIDVPIGAQPAVELQGDPAELVLVAPRPFASVIVEIYQGNTLLASSSNIVGKKPVSSGWMLQASLDTQSLGASLDPYTVMWKCSDTSVPGVTRFTSQLFLVNASIIDAQNDVQQCVMKARNTLRAAHDLLFDPPTVMAWLRRGRDQFNGAGGILTEFNMTAANGPIREYWLRYSEAAALQAQYLAEGEKSFNYSAPDVSLDVDHSQFYDTLANNILQSVNETVATFKKNLILKGYSAGDGSSTGISEATWGAMGAVGVNWNQVSPRWGYQTMGPFYPR